MSTGPRLRFAPSPTGSLHLGNARTALFNWATARAAKGTFIVRVEDTDIEREAEGSEEGILEDLDWLGLRWDEGPGVGGPYGPYRQSERGAGYRDAAKRLLDAGSAFRCFCVASTDEASRAAAQHAAGSAAGHRDPCRGLSPAESLARATAGEAHAIRFRVPRESSSGGRTVRFRDRLHGDVEVPLAQVPDGVLTRSDGRPTYNFAVVVDDEAMRIDLVLRGDDHLSNTPLQVLLYEALGSRPPEFAHVPMVLGSDGQRLSKRHGATSVAAWRASGIPAEALDNALALLGWSPPGDRTIVSLDEIVAEFDLDRVGRSAATFDPAKLEWISSQHIHALPAARLAREVSSALERAGVLPAGAAGRAPEWVAAVAEFLRPALARFDQIAAQAEPVVHPGGALGDDERGALGQPSAKEVLAALHSYLQGREAPSWGEMKAAAGASSGASGKALMQPIRIALTGRLHGRELDKLVPLIVDGQRRLPSVVPSLTARIERTMAEIS